MGNDFMQQIQALAAMLGQGGIGHNTPGQAPNPMMQQLMGLMNGGGGGMGGGANPMAGFHGGMPPMHAPHQAQVMGAHDMASQLAQHIARNRHQHSPFAPMMGGNAMGGGGMGGGY